jgi:phosphoglycolate phosphatase-like HAD superfamily hydrolase
MTNIKPIIFFDLDGTLVDQESFETSTPIVFASRELLRDLNQNYDLGIITGATRDELESILKSMGWNELFCPNNIVTASDIPLPKVTGAPFEYAKKLTTGISVMIGDSENDAIGSLKADLPCILIDLEVQDRAAALIAAIERAKELIRGQA